MPKTPNAATPSAATVTPILSVPPLLTLDRTAEILGTSVRTVQRLIKAGTLPAFKEGRLVRVRPADLRAYIDVNTS